MKIIRNKKATLDSLDVGDTFTWDTESSDSLRTFMIVNDINNTVGYLSFETNMVYPIDDFNRKSHVRLVDTVLTIL